jgi:hypothetical protein
MSYRYRVSADIRRVSGFLKGVTVSRGFSLTVGSLAETVPYVEWLDARLASGEPVHGEYVIVSAPMVTPLAHVRRAEG